jgi:hypothetical protein
VLRLQGGSIKPIPPKTIVQLTGTHVVDKVEFFESLRYVSPPIGLSERTGLGQSPVTSGHASGIQRLNGPYSFCLAAEWCMRHRGHTR